MAKKLMGFINSGKESILDTKSRTFAFIYVNDKGSGVLYRNFFADVWPKSGDVTLGRLIGSLLLQPMSFLT